MDTLREIGERCRERGMHFFVSIYWLTRSYLSEGSWRKSATQDGFVDEYSPPCPLDEEYISRIIEAQSVALARIARECNIDGIVYDGELYGAWPTRYSNKTCFCDHCFYSFLESIGRKDKVEPARRRSWLLESKALDRYYSYQGKRLASILSKIAKECRQYDHDLVFGLLGNSLDNWYVEAMARSMSAKGLPFLILDETSYVRGFSRSFGYGAPAYRLPTGLTYPEYMTRKIARNRLNAVWVGAYGSSPGSTRRPSATTSSTWLRAQEDTGSSTSPRTPAAGSGSTHMEMQTRQSTRHFPEAHQPGCSDPTGTSSPPCTSPHRYPWHATSSQPRVHLESSRQGSASRE